MSSGGFSKKEIGSIFGHRIKALHRKVGFDTNFDFNRVVTLFDFVKVNNLNLDFVKAVIHQATLSQNEDLIYVANSIFAKMDTNYSVDQIIIRAEEVASKLSFDVDKSSVTNWVIGQIKADSIGKISLSKLSELLTSEKAQL